MPCGSARLVIELGRLSLSCQGVLRDTLSALHVPWLFGSRYLAGAVCLAAVHTLASWPFDHPMQGSVFYAMNHEHYRASSAHTTDTKQLQSLVWYCCTTSKLHHGTNLGAAGMRV